MIARPDGPIIVCFTDFSRSEPIEQLLKTEINKAMEISCSGQAGKFHF